MPYSSVVGFARMEIQESNLGLLNSIYPNDYYHTVYVIVTPIDINGNYVDIQSELTALFTEGKISIVNYLDGSSLTHLKNVVDANGSTVAFERNNALYIKCQTTTGLTGLSYYCAAVQFILPDGTKISTMKNSGSGFDNAVVFSENHT